MAKLWSPLRKMASGFACRDGAGTVFSRRLRTDFRRSCGDWLRGRIGFSLVKILESSGVLAELFSGEAAETGLRARVRFHFRGSTGLA